VIGSESGKGRGRPPLPVAVAASRHLKPASRQIRWTRSRSSPGPVFPRKPGFVDSIARVLRRSSCIALSTVHLSAQLSIHNPALTGTLITARKLVESIAHVDIRRPLLATNRRAHHFFAATSSESRYPDPACHQFLQRGISSSSSAAVDVHRLKRAESLAPGVNSSPADPCFLPPRPPAFVRLAQDLHHLFF